VPLLRARHGALGVERCGGGGGRAGGGRGRGGGRGGGGRREVGEVVELLALAAAAAALAGAVGAVQGVRVAVAGGGAPASAPRFAVDLVLVRLVLR